MTMDMAAALAMAPGRVTVKNTRTLLARSANAAS